MMLTYNYLRAYSDESLTPAVYFMGEFLRNKYFIPINYSKFITSSSEYDDTRNCIDIDIEIPKIRFSHRARNMFGNIYDITIKTQSKYGAGVQCEYDKLINYDIRPELKLLYFYCFFDPVSKEISRYIIYDLKKLILLDDFKNKKLFHYREDKLNKKDGGSHFNCITIKTLKDTGCLLEDYSKQKPKIDNELNKKINKIIYEQPVSTTN